MINAFNRRFFLYCFKTVNVINNEICNICSVTIEVCLIRDEVLNADIQIIKIMFTYILVCTVML